MNRDPDLRPKEWAMVLRYLLLFLSLALPVSAPSLAKPAPPSHQEAAGFKAWVEGTLWPVAKSKGISRATFDMAMAGVTPETMVGW